MSIRLEEKPFEFEGKTYLLRCNMAVLDTLQDEADGDFGSLMRMTPIKGAAKFLTAMLNDYAEEQGWPERWTENVVRRKVNMAMIQEADVIGLVRRALIPPKAENDTSSGADAPPSPRGEGNAEGIVATPENSGN